MKRKRNICTAETSETMRYLLEKVVSEGTGKNAKIEGFSIGGKTATSQTLPRSDHKYISSFLGFAPADNPQVLVLVVINNPQGDLLRRNDRCSGGEGNIRKHFALP